MNIFMVKFRLTPRTHADWVHVSLSLLPDSHSGQHSHAGVNFSFTPGSRHAYEHIKVPGLHPFLRVTVPGIPALDAAPLFLG